MYYAFIGKCKVRLLSFEFQVGYIPMVHHVPLCQINSYSHFTASAHSRDLSSVGFSDHLWVVYYHSLAWLENPKKLIAFIVLLYRHEHANSLRVTAWLYRHVCASKGPNKLFVSSAATCAVKYELRPPVRGHGPVSYFEWQVPNHRLLPLALLERMLTHSVFRASRNVPIAPSYK